MKRLFLLSFISLFSLLISCGSDDSDDTSQNTNTSNTAGSRTIRLEAELDGATEIQISYEVRNTAIVVTEEEGIRSRSKWTKTLNVDGDFNLITLNVANISLEGKVIAKVYVGDKLIGNNTSGTAAIVVAPAL